jgi:hypothetical protein
VDTGFASQSSLRRLRILICVSRATLKLAHNLVGEPVPTSPDHAPTLLSRAGNEIANRESDVAKQKGRPEGGPFFIL